MRRRRPRIRPRVKLLGAFLLAVFLAAAPARAGIVIRIDLSEQLMRVAEDGVALYEWPVSTARAGKCTPVGTYTPDFLSPFHRSSLYDNAPMPWSIFFSGNYAIHGTDQIELLGRPASAGCVRLHPENAEVLYRMVEAAGLAATRIVIEP